MATDLCTSGQKKSKKGLDTTKKGHIVDNVLTRKDYIMARNNININTESTVARAVVYKVWKGLTLVYFV